MATDIAFAIGVLTLLKGRIPHALIVFLTALAIFDDLGGILVIAVFYGSGLHLEYLLASGLIVAALAVLNKLYVRNGLVYAFFGVALWYTIHHAGIHATISGVLLGMMIPARSRHAPHQVLRELAGYLQGILQRPAEEEDLGNEEIHAIEERLGDLEPPLNRFVHLLHPYVAFAIIPIFALANAGVDVRGSEWSALLSPVPLGIALGLFVGKQVGIFGFTFVALRLGWSMMPGGASGMQLWGVSMVAGIGFTVALFVASLAYPTAEVLDQAKLGILVGSFVAALGGYAVLRLARPSPAPS
jgi:Na+:H+ antiporter, NhaA family